MGQWCLTQSWDSQSTFLAHRKYHTDIITAEQPKQENKVTVKTGYTVHTYIPSTVRVATSLMALLLG